MSDGDRVQVEGARELRAALDRLALDLDDFTEAHAAVAVLIEDAARPRIRSRSGRLAASGRASGTKTAAVLAYGVVYANAVHWGTGPRPGRRGPHNIAPNRFASDAATATEAQATAIYHKATTDRVDAAISRSRHT